MSSIEKIVIVTGAGSGIGKVSALALLKEGYSVVLAGRRISLLEEVASEAKSSGPMSLSNFISPKTLAIAFAGASLPPPLLQRHIK